MKIYLIEYKNLMNGMDASVIVAKSKTEAMDKFCKHNGFDYSPKEIEELFCINEYGKDEIIHIIYYE